MENITIHGNLVKDAELVPIGERQQVKFTVACNEGKGEKRVTTYYDCLYHATQIQPYLLKGKDVIVMGRLSVRTSQGNDGRAYVNLNVYADRVELCGRRDDTPHTVEPTAQPQAQPQQMPPSAPKKDPLPF